MRAWLRTTAVALFCCGLFAVSQAQIGPAPGGGGSSSGANPTATASGTAVNGSASTFLRSDGAPAVQKGTSAQFGLLQTDGASINATNCNIATPAASVICAGLPGANGSNYWKLPAGISTNPAAGGVQLASAINCFPGGVDTQVTIKSLGARVTSGNASSAVALGIYYISVDAGVITLHHIDHTGSIATASNNADASAAVGNTTDVLYPGVLYVFCTQANATAGQTLVSVNTTSTQAVRTVGSTTLGVAILWTSNFNGWTKAITYGVWDSTYTLNNGAGDMTETGSNRVAVIVYQVN